MITGFKEHQKFELTYNFTPEEIRILSKFLRSKEAELPKGLGNFTRALENSVYECLSLEEIKEFFS